MDALAYTSHQFDIILNQNRVSLDKASRDLVQAAIAFPDIQFQVQTRLDFAHDTARMTKVIKRELGGLTRSFASYVAVEIRRGGLTQHEAIVSAFKRWRQTRAFTSVAGRFHSGTSGAACGARFK